MSTSRISSMMRNRDPITPPPTPKDMIPRHFMGSCLTRFIGYPIFCSQLVGYLDKEDIFSLCLTSRALKAGLRSAVDGIHRAKKARIKCPACVTWDEDHLCTPEKCNRCMSCKRDVCQACVKKAGLDVGIKMQGRTRWYCDPCLVALHEALGMVNGHDCACWNVNPRWLCPSCRHEDMTVMTDYIWEEMQGEGHLRKCFECAKRISGRANMVRKCGWCDGRIIRN